MIESRVQIYEGHLPGNVSKSFEFLYVLKAKGETNEYSTSLRHPSRDKIKKTDYSQKLRNTALDNAKRSLKELLTDRAYYEIEIVADFHIIRENESSGLDDRKVGSNGGYYPVIELEIEAIGYRRKIIPQKKLAVTEETKS